MIRLLERLVLAAVTCASAAACAPTPTYFHSEQQLIREPKPVKTLAGAGGFAVSVIGLVGSIASLPSDGLIGVAGAFFFWASAVGSVTSEVALLGCFLPSPFPAARAATRTSWLPSVHSFRPVLKGDAQIK